MGNVDRKPVVNTPMRAVEDIRRGTSVREVPEESLTLTGDEKIVDVDFSPVFWSCRPERRR